MSLHIQWYVTCAVDKVLFSKQKRRRCVGVVILEISDKIPFVIFSLSSEKLTNALPRKNFK
jgi:hypothetical protein